MKMTDRLRAMWSSRRKGRTTTTPVPTRKPSLMTRLRSLVRRTR